MVLFSVYIQRFLFEHLSPRQRDSLHSGNRTTSGNHLIDEERQEERDEVLNAMSMETHMYICILTECCSYANNWRGVTCDMMLKLNIQPYSSKKLKIKCLITGTFYSGAVKHKIYDSTKSMSCIEGILKTDILTTGWMNEQFLWFKVLSASLPVNMPQLSR